MIAIISERNGVKKFIADKKDDLLNMNLRSTRMGSVCFVIEEDKSYILNGSGKWVAISNSKGKDSSSDDEGSSSDPSDGVPSDTPTDETNHYI